MIFVSFCFVFFVFIMEYMDIHGNVLEFYVVKVFDLQHVNLTSVLSGDEAGSEDTAPSKAQAKRS